MNPQNTGDNLDLEQQSENNLTARSVQQLLRRFYLTILLYVIRSEAPDQRLDDQNVLTTADFKVSAQEEEELRSMTLKTNSSITEKRESGEVEVKVLQSKSEVRRCWHRTLRVVGSRQWKLGSTYFTYFTLKV